jgi:Amt family ammonium transporter
MGGTIGAVLTGVFASNVINPIFGKDAPVGLIDGHGHQILSQLVGVGIAWALAIVGTVVILKVVDVVIGLRVSAEHEVEGLDITQHGEEGYYWEASVL